MLCRAVQCVIHEIDEGGQEETDRANGAQADVEKILGCFRCCTIRCCTVSNHAFSR